jgi:hypothetical protein
MGQVSDGSTADYYQLPAGCTELQDLISYRNLNAQDGEIFRAIYRKGRASHSDELRDAKKVLFYAQAEVKRLEALTNAKRPIEHFPTPYIMPATFGQQNMLSGGPLTGCIGCKPDDCPCKPDVDHEKLERWRRAPKDATHWAGKVQGCAACWYKKLDNGRWVCMYDDGIDDKWGGASMWRDLEASLEPRPCAN